MWDLSICLVFVKGWHIQTRAGWHCLLIIFNISWFFGNTILTRIFQVFNSVLVKCAHEVVKNWLVIILTWAEMKSDIAKHFYLPFPSHQFVKLSSTAIKNCGDCESESGQTHLTVNWKEKSLIWKWLQLITLRMWTRTVHNVSTSHSLWYFRFFSYNHITCYTWPESKCLVINIHNSEQTLKMYLQYHFFPLCVTIVTKPSVFSIISVKLRMTQLLIVKIVINRPLESLTLLVLILICIPILQ